MSTDMQKINRDTVEKLLRTKTDPYFEKDLISAGVIRDIQITDEKITLNINLGFPSTQHQKNIEESYRDFLIGELSEVFNGEVIVECRGEVSPHKVQRNLRPLPEVKNIIAIASGKGGVGKSTTAANLALSLLKEGANVGLLDADIYGPSLPTILGTHERPKPRENETMDPVIAQGLQTNSIGFLIDPKDAAIWRGPMVVSALTQLVSNTNWQDLDYLIVDLPPGTGDIQLTMAQKIPVSGSVIVTTPQDMALADAIKGINMFEKVSVPILGVVENMSVYICSQCGHEEHIFGSEGGDRLARDFNVELLGRMPLDIRIREESDRGKPTAIHSSELSESYREIALKMVARLALREKHIEKAPANRNIVQLKL